MHRQVKFVLVLDSEASKLSSVTVWDQQEYLLCLVLVLFCQSSLSSGFESLVLREYDLSRCPHGASWHRVRYCNVRREEGNPASMQGLRQLYLLQGNEGHSAGRYDRGAILYRPPTVPVSSACFLVGALLGPYILGQTKPCI